MPVESYYGGRGKKVMASMKKQYGEAKGEEVFYATANKRKQKSEHKALKGLRDAKPK